MRGLLGAALFALATAAHAAVPTVPAIQDFASDSIRKGCRDLGFPRPVSERLCATTEKAIEEGAVPCQDGYRRLTELAASPGAPSARATADAVFEDARRVLDIRDRARADTYGSLPPRNRLRALAHADAQALKSRGKGPAGIEAAIVALQKNGGAPLRKLFGIDTRRSDQLDLRLRELAADRRALTARRTALFTRTTSAVKGVAPDPAIEKLAGEWRQLEDDTARLDRAQLAIVQEELTLAEKLHAARELLPMIDRGMRWAAVYFKVRGVFNARQRRAED